MAETLKRTLHYAMEGPDVKAVKRALTRLNLRDSRNNTGFYGHELAQQVHSFQEKHPKTGKANGIYNQATHDVMVHQYVKAHTLAWDGFCDFLMKSTVLTPPIMLRRQKLVSAFMYMYSKRPTHYTQGSERDDYLNGPKELWNYPRASDCSATFTWCYWLRGEHDPNGLNYSPIGYTGTLVKNGHLVAIPKLGDAIFYGRNSAGDPTHVAMYVGNRMVLSNGSEGGPRLLDMRYRHDRHSMRSYL